MAALPCLSTLSVQAAFKRLRSANGDLAHLQSRTGNRPADPKARRAASPVGPERPAGKFLKPYSAGAAAPATLETSTLMPGPMVEVTDTRFR
jgi:hypothetical protein